MPRKRRADDPPILHPETRSADGPLPSTVPLLAALGLAVLCLCTLPAVHAQRVLERDHARLMRATRQIEGRAERLEQELRSGARQRYLRVKATRTLLQHGADYVRDRDRRLRDRR